MTNADLDTAIRRPALIEGSARMSSAEAGTWPRPGARPSAGTAADRVRLAGRAFSRAAERLRALLHAQALLRGMTGAESEPGWVEDDRRRLVGRRQSPADGCG